MALDPMIKLFDIRTMKNLDPIPFESCPSFLRFHPKYPSILISVSQSGELLVVNINQPTEPEYYEVFIQKFNNKKKKKKKTKKKKKKKKKKH